MPAVRRYDRVIVLSAEIKRILREQFFYNYRGCRYDNGERAVLNSLSVLESLD
jgi:hypothetical protein